MQLRKLQLVGFKTFAEKTEIEIGEGLTAVVGPNGSGKSNIADAILWALGEQNPRLLRGSESRDVIFAGTDKRKPLGMAEVRLTLDNSDKSLPIDFSEVVVTRRVYRSGESQYLLNGSPCRLKDIVDLFLDTGMGRGAYSFVSQSEIDAVLSVRPEDRRELFEEAAGIKKYRVKKREAVRKLDSAEGNLNRIRDILHELEQQIEPMSEQAETARRYLQLTERLHDIEIGLLVAEAKRADYELYASKQERDLDRELIGKFDAELTALERESEAVGARLAEAEQQADSARSSEQAALTTVERTEAQLQLIIERGATAEQSADSLDEELRELAARTATLAQEIQRQTEALHKLEKDEQKRKAELDAARTTLNDLEQKLTAALRDSQDRQGVLLRLAEQRAQREAALQNTRRQLDETRQRIANLESESTSSTETLDTARKRLADLKKSLADSIRESEELSADRDSCAAERRALRDEEARIRTSLESERRLLAERTSRLAALVEMQESGEGFYQGVRAVLNAHRQGILKGSYTPAVDLIDVPEELRVAVEVALGGSLQDIVCDTEAEAKAAVEWLKRERAGRATFLALPSLRPAPATTLPSKRGADGILGLGMELVRADSKYQGVLQLLLGRVVIVDTMESALTASRTLQGWSRIVTLQGELVTPGGALTGGSLQGKGAHLIGRKGEIDDLRKALPQIEKQIAQLVADSESSSDRLRDVEGRIAQTEQGLSVSGSAIATTRSEIASAERDVYRLESVMADLKAECDRLDATRGTLDSEVARWTDEVAHGAREDSGVDEAIATAQREAERLRGLVDRARRNSTTLEVETGRLGEKRAALERALVSDRSAAAGIERDREAKQLQREMQASRFADAATQRTELERRLESARKHLSDCEARLAEWTQKRQTLLNENFEKTGAIKEINQRRAKTLQEMHDAELTIARMEVRLAQAAQRLDEQYAISLEDALARPDSDDLDKSTVNEISRLRREIRAMGQVNTGAVEEYERLTERHAFLAGQREDLENARQSLLDTIAEIDESTRGVFMETFEAVSLQFSAIFQRLFGGGSTKLSLTRPDDLLETGIDVIAQPPGKKAQQLTLLSGGERALTAVALLFSFLAVRPSPFVLLDEVDAPLDGPNVEKFVSLVNDFARDTQFLVITHNPTTMEAAPTWYGVTMQEPGISRILSYRVPESAVVSQPESALVAPV